MSAIFGIISKYGKLVEPQFAETMKKTLQHRAVDGKGFYQTDTAFIGHYKFISNIHQKKEQQPIEDEFYIIAADARIDNREELIKLLEIKLLDVSDAYLILKAYNKWKRNCTDHLAGEFAFVIYNKLNRTVFAATDHIGFRSFYYYDTPDYFIFSSELKGICALDFVSKEYNDQILIEYFSFHFSNITPYKNIYTLLNSSHLVFDKNNLVKITKYWKLEATGKYKFKKDSDWADCLKELMFKAVRNRINTDLPVGIQLSGGLDSSFVAAITSSVLKEKNKPLIAFSSMLPLKYTGLQQDESAYIKALVKFSGNIELHSVNVPTGIGLFANAEEMLYKMECFGLSSSQILIQHIYAAAKEKGINVLLNGLGGDTTISYPGDVVLWEMIKKIEIGNAIKLVRQKRRQGSSISKILKYDILKNIYFIQNYRRNNHVQFHLLKNELRQKVINNQFPAFGFYKDYISYRVNNTAGFGIGLSYDRNLSACYNFEPASPIYDKNIFEFFSDLPLEQTILNGQNRSLIRRAMKGMVPDYICERTDKQPYLPDLPDRFTIDLENVLNLLIADEYIMQNTGIDSDKLIVTVKNIKDLRIGGKATAAHYSVVHVLFLYYCFNVFFGKNNESLNFI